jgi:hypothetical protein
MSLSDLLCVVMQDRSTFFIRNVEVGYLSWKMYSTPWEGMYEGCLCPVHFALATSVASFLAHDDPFTVSQLVPESLVVL